MLIIWEPLIMQELLILIMQGPKSGRSWTSKVLNTVITLDTYQFQILLCILQYDIPCANTKKYFFSQNQMSESKNPYLYKNFTADYFEIKSEHNLLVYLGTNASSFYRSQNNLGWSKCFGPDQKLFFILCTIPKFLCQSKR